MVPRVLVQRSQARNAGLLRRYRNSRSRNGTPHFNDVHCVPFNPHRGEYAKRESGAYSTDRDSANAAVLQISDAPSGGPRVHTERRKTKLDTSHRTRRSPTDGNQLGALIAALILAILIAICITTGAFALSFAVQRDLARQGTLPKNFAWIFPVIVDSAILGSTIAIVILTKLKMSRWDKGFYIALAIAVVAISVLGNAYHAFDAATEAQRQVVAGTDIGYVALDPVIAAVIAIISPALVLAVTHGLGILIRATGIAYTDYKGQIDDHSVKEQVHPVIEHRGVQKPSADFAQQALVLDETMNQAFQPEQHPDDSDRVDPPAMNPDLPADLDWFITQSDLPDAVKDTARRKLADPALTWEVIAQTPDPPVATSTSWRRYEKFDAAARIAGFENPPLIDMRSSDINYIDHVVASS